MLPVDPVAGEAAGCFQFCEGKICIAPAREGGGRWQAVAPSPVAAVVRSLEFSWLDGTLCRAVEVAEEGCGEWVPLRQSYSLLSLTDYRKACKAAELLHWDRHSRYCGCCGSSLQWASPISKYCPQCHTEQWPRLSPAIIVLISRGDEVLLVRSRSFKRDWYGLVSGFVELGETLEECLHREVMEETGLKVTGVTYAGSQSWPFPRNLMAGFYATWASGTLRLQQEELIEGGWFRYDSLPPVPDRPSIARQLIDRWRASFP